MAATAPHQHRLAPAERHPPRLAWPWPPALLALAGLVGTAVTAVVVSRSAVLLHPVLSGVGRAAFVGANVAGGAYTWWRRPASGFGPLFAATGLLFALTSLNALADPAAFTVGRVLYALVMAALIYAFLAFPRARLSTTRERRFVAVAGLLLLGLWVLTLALARTLPPAGPFSECAGPCPHNAFRVVSGASGAGRVFGALANATTAAAFVVVTLVLLARLRGAGAARRRTLAPLFLAMSALLLSLVAYTVARQGLGSRPVALSAAVALSILLIPVAIVTGQVRGRLFAARRLGTLVADVGAALTPERVQGIAADALGDPALLLARWDERAGAYRALDGRLVGPETAPGEGRQLELTRAGQPYAFVRYDPAVDQPPDVVRGVAAGALLLLENAGLAAERGRLVAELRASRRRMAEATHESRLRIERDLHDGVQPRLNALLIKLGLARDTVDDTETRALLEEIADDAAGAVEELRRLARGVYPPVLRDRGLAEGLRDFAATAPVPVRVREEGANRASPAATAAVYFTVLEAIQNAIKHGPPATRVAVRLCGGDRLEFTVDDDGPGFDLPITARGVGLISMEDRIGAAGGELRIDSAPGRGTTVHGWVPAE